LPAGLEVQAERGGELSVTHDVVAFTCALLDAVAVEKHDVAAPVPDQAPGLAVPAPAASLSSAGRRAFAPDSAKALRHLVGVARVANLEAAAYQAKHFPPNAGAFLPQWRLRR
jgi:hypothetical protein